MRALDFRFNGRGPVFERHVIEDGIFELHGGLEAALDGTHGGTF